MRKTECYLFNHSLTTLFVYNVCSVRFSRRVTRRTLTQLDDAREVVVGRCDDVMIRRDEVWWNYC